MREYRVEAGWSQRQLAEAAGRTVWYICRVERGQVQISVQVLAELAFALGVKVADLAGDILPM